MSNIITAVFGGNSRYCTTHSVFQIDKGDVLRFVGLDLPEYYEVHFSNNKNALATRVFASGDSVVIPWEFMRHGQKEVYAWIYLTPDAQTGYTPYQVTIPLATRSDISESQPTPAQKDIVDEAISALNEGVERAENAADKAEEATEHYPRIVNGYWQVWAAEAQTWQDTGVKAVGEDGAPGAPGQPGRDGATGPTGKSAYESAQDGGYSGTEAQFNSDLAEVGDKYEKPSGGIPKSDLSSAVQASLDKADTALQEHQSLAAYRTSADQDVIDSGKLSLTGGTMTGAIAMGGNKVTGLANGTNAQDAVTKAQLDAAVIGALKPSGSIAFASLPALTASVLNNVYNITDAFTTTSDFVEGAGKTYPAGSNVAIINVGTELTPVYKYDVYTGIIDLSLYRTASDQDVIDAGKLSTTGDGSNVTATFSTASSRTNISTGEKLSVLFGKIAKWLADLGSAAFRAATNAITQGSTDLVESGAVYTGLAAKQPTITAAGLLKGDGSGGVSAATPGTDYATPQQVNAKYTKPASGIPATDMAQGVQTSLGKADTALQAVPGTYRTAAAQDVINALLGPTIPGTTQTVTFDANGQPQSIVHSDGSTAVRADVFTWTTCSVTEVRTLSTGEHITITTNLVTLVTVVSDIQEAV